MPLTLILGRAGCGKIAYMAEQIKEKIDTLAEGEQITLIVPDQYTVASENFFLDRLGEKKFRRLNVTSLKSLARTEFAAHGVPARFIGEGGKIVLLKKAFDAVAPQLKFFPPDYRNPRFLPLVLGAFKEMKAAGVESDGMLQTALAHQNDKMHDLALIRQMYEAYLSEGYFDPDDAPVRLCKLLAETGNFENEWVYVANFRSFYKRERDILLQMVKNGANLVISLPTDTRDAEKAGALADAAQEWKTLEASVDPKEFHTVLRTLPKAFAESEFGLLEEEFYNTTSRTVKNEAPCVHLFRGADRFDEAEYAASVIAKKVREEGCRYSDFTVIVRSLSDYADILDPIFEQYEIPLFYHRRTPLRQRSPMPFIQALFAMATEGLSRENVLAFVKSGFCTTPEKASWFERYVNVWKISYNRFKTPFLQCIDGFLKDGRKENPRQTAMREGAEEVRRKVVDTVEEFRRKTQKATVREISTALYETLQSLNVSEILNRNAENYRKYGEYELAERQKKVYEQLMLSLDELVLTAGEDEKSLSDYRDLFFAVIDTHDVAILPTSLDEVTAGSPETLPMVSPRFVFVLGLNEGIFPLNIRDDGLLNDEDRELFRIGEKTDDKINHELYYLYTSLTAPREALYLSYASVVGGEVHPSSAVDRVKRIFPELKTESFSVRDPESLSARLQSERAAFALHTKTPVAELAEYFETVPEYREILAKRERVMDLSPKTAERLYSSDMKISASQTDSYYQCRFAHFLRYGLGISSRGVAEFNPQERGNVIHEALEKLMEKALQVEEGELPALVEAYQTEKLASLYGGQAVPENMRSFFDALMEKVLQLLLLFRKELQLAKFHPVSYEQEIGEKKGKSDESTPATRAVPSLVIPLDNGTLSVIGKVDRVDEYEKDGVKYLRIVDYKSGKKEFSRTKVRYGIDVQMLLYLYVLKQNFYPEGPAQAAGVQYISVNPSAVNLERTVSPEQVLIEWERNMPRSGLYLKEDHVLEAMDPTEDLRYLRIEKAKQETSEFLATAEDFGEIFEQIQTLLRRMGDEILQGKLTKNPMRIGSKYDSCQYCDLRYYCRPPEVQDVGAFEDEKKAAQAAVKTAEEDVEKCRKSAVSHAEKAEKAAAAAQEQAEKAAEYEKNRSKRAEGARAKANELARKAEEAARQAEKAEQDLTDAIAKAEAAARFAEEKKGVFPRV